MMEMTRAEVLRELVVLLKLLYPQVVVKNPRIKLLERATHARGAETLQLAWELTEGITRLNQCFRLRKGARQIESTREDNLNALSLLKEYINPLSLEYRGAVATYRVIVRNYSEETFTQREVRKHSGYSKTETSRQMRILLRYNVIEITGGQRNRGYVYRLI